MGNLPLCERTGGQLSVQHSQDGRGTSWTLEPQMLSAMRGARGTPWPGPKVAQLDPYLASGEPGTGRQEWPLDSQMPGSGFGPAQLKPQHFAT